VLPATPQGRAAEVFTVIAIAYFLEQILVSPPS